MYLKMSARIDLEDRLKGFEMSLLPHQDSAHIRSLVYGYIHKLTQFRFNKTVDKNVIDNSWDKLRQRRLN